MRFSAGSAWPSGIVPDLLGSVGRSHLLILFNLKTMKNIPIQEKSAIGMLVAGIAFALIALLVPPVGQIHESVCWVFAQCLIYAGSVFGIATYIEHLHQRLLVMPRDRSLRVKS